MENENTKNINISNDVITTIVTVAAKEVEGVTGIYNQLESNVSKIFKKKNVVNGIDVNIDEEKNTIDVDLSITVEFGTELMPIGTKVQAKVKDAIENMTSFKVNSVNVKVANVKEVTKEI